MDTEASHAIGSLDLAHDVGKVVQLGIFNLNGLSL